MEHAAVMPIPLHPSAAPAANGAPPPQADARPVARRSQRLRQADARAHSADAAGRPSGQKPRPWPPELLDQVLLAVDGQDLPTVRALSQSSRHLEQRMARLHPLPFGQAHVKTLERAFLRKTLDVTQPRNARVLAAMTKLHLLDKRPGSLSLPPRALAALPEQVLGKVARALPPVQSLTLGTKAQNLSLYTGLLGAGLNTSALTTLNLEHCACIAPQELDVLSANLHQFSQLIALTFPSTIAPRGSVDAPLDPGLPRYDFAPLAHLETFTWWSKNAVSISALDFCSNPSLRSLTLCMAPETQMRTKAEGPGMQLLLPDAPLVTLRLRPLHVSPDGGNPFANAPWQASLRQLSVGALITDDLLDLSAYGALQHLTLAQDKADLRRLRLPAKPGLTKLRVAGKHAQALFDQMANLLFDHLTFLLLAVAPEPQQALHIPWKKMPKLSRLSYEYKGRSPLPLGRLGLPRNNRITRLDLRGRYLANRADPTLKDLPLPRLRDLDVVYYRLTRPFVLELSYLLEPDPVWPRLARIVLHRQEPRTDLKTLLTALAQEYGFQIAIALPPQT